MKYLSWFLRLPKQSLQYPPSTVSPARMEMHYIKPNSSWTHYMTSGNYANKLQTIHYSYCKYRVNDFYLLALQILMPRDSFLKLKWCLVSGWILRFPYLILEEAALFFIFCHVLKSFVLKFVLLTIFFCRFDRGIFAKYFVVRLLLGILEKSHSCFQVSFRIDLTSVLT